MEPPDCSASGLVDTVEKTMGPTDHHPSLFPLMVGNMEVVVVVSFTVIDVLDGSVGPDTWDPAQ